MAATKKSKSKETALPKEKPSIQKMVTDFVGPVKNLLKIKSHNIYENRYRINVWVKDPQPDCFVDRIYIKHSWFVKIEDENIVDLTIEKNEKSD